MTRILSAIEQGDPQAAEQLLPLVYGELRQLAAQKIAQESPARRRPMRWASAAAPPTASGRWAGPGCFASYRNSWPLAFLARKPP